MELINLYVSSANQNVFDECRELSFFLGMGQIISISSISTTGAGALILTQKPGRSFVFIPSFCP